MTVRSGRGGLCGRARGAVSGGGANRKTLQERTNKMAVLGQGLVLMLTGMGIVFAFLLVLIGVTKATMGFVGRFDSILPQEAPKKAPARKAAGGGDDADIALAIAVALG